MADLAPEIVDEVAAACRAGASEAAEAFGRVMDSPVSVSVGQSATVEMGSLPEELSGPGLAVVLTVGGRGAVLVLPEGSGLLPGWCASPDATGESRLATLAQELGMLVLPEQLMPEDFKALRVDSLADAIRLGEVSDGAGMVPLELSFGDKQGVARLIWPAARPEAITCSTTPERKPQPEPQGVAQSRPHSEAKRSIESGTGPVKKTFRHKARLRDLPDYTRSLLRIKVPVIVTLADKRQPLSRIVELSPGSIIQFEKSCEEMLELGVGDRPVASGEAVKVGDKFGLRITSIILPEERFTAVKALK